MVGLIDAKSDAETSALKGFLLMLTIMAAGVALGSAFAAIVSRVVALGFGSFATTGVYVPGVIISGAARVIPGVMRVAPRLTQFLSTNATLYSLSFGINVGGNLMMEYLDAAGVTEFGKNGAIEWNRVGINTFHTYLYCLAFLGAGRVLMKGIDLARYQTINPRLAWAAEGWAVKVEKARKLFSPSAWHEPKAAQGFFRGYASNTSKEILEETIQTFAEHANPLGFLLGVLAGMKGRHANPEIKAHIAETFGLSFERGKFVYTTADAQSFLNKLDARFRNNPNMKYEAKIRKAGIKGRETITFTLTDPSTGKKLVFDVTPAKLDLPEEVRIERVRGLELDESTGRYTAPDSKEILLSLADLKSHGFTVSPDQGGFNVVGSETSFTVDVKDVDTRKLAHQLIADPPAMQKIITLIESLGLPTFMGLCVAVFSSGSAKAQVTAETAQEIAEQSEGSDTTFLEDASNFVVEDILGGLIDSPTGILALVTAIWASKSMFAIGRFMYRKSTTKGKKWTNWVRMGKRDSEALGDVIEEENLPTMDEAIKELSCTKHARFTKNDKGIAEGIYNKILTIFGSFSFTSGNAEKKIPDNIENGKNLFKRMFQLSFVSSRIDQLENRALELRKKALTNEEENELADLEGKLTHKDKAFIVLSQKGTSIEDARRESETLDRYLELQERMLTEKDRSDLSLIARELTVLIEEDEPAIITALAKAPLSIASVAFGKQTRLAKDILPLIEKYLGRNGFSKKDLQHFARGLREIGTIPDTYVDYKMHKRKLFEILAKKKLLQRRYELSVEIAEKFNEDYPNKLDKDKAPLFERLQYDRAMNIIENYEYLERRQGIEEGHTSKFKRLLRDLEAKPFFSHLVPDRPMTRRLALSLYGGAIAWLLFSGLWNLLRDDDEDKKDGSKTPDKDNDKTEPEEAEAKIEKKRADEALKKGDQPGLGKITKVSPEVEKKLNNKAIIASSEYGKKGGISEAKKYGIDYQFESIFDAVKSGKVVLKYEDGLITGAEVKNQSKYKLFDNHPSRWNYKVIPKSEKTFEELKEEKKKGKNPKKASPAGKPSKTTPQVKSRL